MKTRSHVRSWALLGAACVALTGCSAEAPDGATSPPSSTPPTNAAACDALQPGKAPIRRLTRTEYNNTVRELLGDRTDPASAFVREEELNGFNNNAEVLGVTAILAEQYMRAAEGIAERATENVARLVPCEGRTDETACVREFINTFGQRALRGPVTEEESNRLFRVYLAGRTESYRTGIALVLQTLLQSSRFLYRVEFGRPEARAVVPLSSWEMASRLSYMLWNSMPDAALFQDAAHDRLRTKEQVLAHATRMLADQRAHVAVANFHEQWLGLDALKSVSKTLTTYPDFTESVRTAMLTETRLFLEHAVWSDAGTVGTLLAAPYTFMNAELAKFYGVRGPTGDAFERVALGSKERVGLLTHASLLSIHAHSDQTSPVARGKFVRQRLFCVDPPPPPADVKAVAPDLDPALTTRERFAAHATQAACSTCHQLMDPIGLGFENYDAVGRYRATENAKPIDASGELILTDVNGRFVGAADLVQQLGKSELVRDCLVTQWFRFGYGRSEGDADACTLSELQQGFKASGGNIRALILALTQTDAFLYRPAIVPVEVPQ